jgi:hypothetical protein
MDGLNTAVGGSTKGKPGAGESMMQQAQSLLDALNKPRQ